MSGKKVVNLVNFVRGCEPRDKNMDLYSPVVNQMEQNRKFGLKCTFLLQYDAMLRDDFCELFVKEVKQGDIELGVWFEMCRVLVEKIGAEWKGRPGYDWDWHVNSGFLPGYTPEQREKIVDEVFAKFKAIFGEYPKVVGSWLLDAHSMDYMCQKYDIKAFCVCREQFGVDAYTLWGGYYSGAYYASKKNMLCPAKTAENSISAPVFRMLGIDPIYGYDEKKFNPKTGGCYTLEPYWTPGKTPDVVDWYFDEYFKNPVMNLSELTTGQENSFGWSGMRDGYIMQAERMAELQKEGVLTVEFLGDTGESFKKSFDRTPSSVLLAEKDWSQNGIKSYWFSSQNLRANLFLNKDLLMFRDIVTYDENYAERYLDRPCEEWNATYDNLQIVDARLWEKDGKPSGLFFDSRVKNMSAEVKNDLLCANVDFENGTSGRVLISENAISFDNCGNVTLCFGEPTVSVELEGDVLKFKYAGIKYSVKINAKSIIENDEGINIIDITDLIPFLG